MRTIDTTRHALPLHNEFAAGNPRIRVLQEKSDLGFRLCHRLVRRPHSRRVQKHFRFEQQHEESDEQIT